MSLYSPLIRSAPRSLLRSSSPLIRPLRPRRQFSLAPPSQRSRSWRNITVRWALAICGIYYYNTSNVFAEEPISVAPIPTPPTDETPVQTIESLASSRQSKDARSNPSLPSNTPPSENSSHPSLDDHDPSSPSLDETAEEAHQEGAFNEETGEINWDCPCLGGMAHGPCGEEFRMAFSCFVFSKADPKGMDCIEHFKGMQDCFRQHPDIYGSELEDDDDFEGYEGDNEPRSPDFDDSASSSRPSASDTALAPRQGDQTSEKPTSSPKSARLNPEVDEPSIYPPTPPVPFQSSSDASQPASPNEQISEDKNQQLALKTLHDANASQAATPNERGSEDEKKQLASKPSHDANQITREK